MKYSEIDCIKYLLINKISEDTKINRINENNRINRIKSENK